MSQTTENGEIHRADPAYRRSMRAWLAACIVGGAALLVVLNLWLNRLYSTLAHADLVSYQTWMNRLLAGMCLLLGIGMAVFGNWLQGMARQSQRERRWPPRSMKTSTDIRIRYLTSTDAFVRQLQTAAWALWFLAVALTGWAGWLIFAP